MGTVRLGHANRLELDLKFRGDKRTSLLQQAIVKIFIFKARAASDWMTTQKMVLSDKLTREREREREEEEENEKRGKGGKRMGENGGEIEV